MENLDPEIINQERVSVVDFSKQLGLEIINEGRGSMVLQSISVCRPGLQLAGYFKHFDHKRIQVIGKAEHEFLKSNNSIVRRACLDEFFKSNIPCLIFARNLEIDDEIISFAKTYDCPVMRSNKITTVLINEITIYQNELLAPTIVKHGVLMDIYGIGVLIMGKSGVGKSEIALDLINRKHRLVADDSVILKNINDEIIGKSPERIKYFIEIRGIGVINVQQMFGPGSVSSSAGVDIIVMLQPWDTGSSYDRLGNEEVYEDILGKKKLKIIVPVSPGRNLPIIIETAVMRYRLKQAGLDPTKELMQRVFGTTEI